MHLGATRLKRLGVACNNPEWRHVEKFAWKSLIMSGTIACPILMSAHLGVSHTWKLIGIQKNKIWKIVNAKELNALCNYSLPLNRLFNSSFNIISHILISLIWIWFVVALCKVFSFLIIVMDTPIRLKCTNMALQKPFLGKISNDLLAMVCKVDGQSPFIRHAICMVLGHEFLKNDKRYHMSTDITSCFLVSLLNLEAGK